MNCEALEYNGRFATTLKLHGCNNLCIRGYPGKRFATALISQGSNMGYAPPLEWRRPEPTLHIFLEEEKH